VGQNKPAPPVRGQVRPARRLAQGVARAEGRVESPVM